MKAPGEDLIIKLWETLTEKGIGGLLRPWSVVRLGRAQNEVRRDEILMLAQAHRDADDLRAGRMKRLPDGSVVPCIPLTSSIGTQPREEISAINSAVDIAHRNASINLARSEINTARAVIFAEEQLLQETKTAPAEKIDDDWIHNWYEYAGKVSAEQLQRMWGAVLAGEVTSPGSFSLRTLELLRTLSKKEAAQITTLAPFVISKRIVRENSEFLTSKGVTLDLLMSMQNIGILSGVESLGLSASITSVVKENFTAILDGHGLGLLVENEDPNATITLRVALLTEAGLQLLRLGSFNSDVDYFNMIGELLKEKGFSVSIADIVSEDESTVQLANMRKI